MQGRNRVTGRIVCSMLCLIVAFSLQAQTVDETAIKNKISKVAGRIGISAANIKEAVITKTYTDKNSSIEYVYLQQTYKGIPVYNSIKTLAFKGDELIYSSGKWTDKTERLSSDTAVLIEAAEAIKKAVAHLHISAGKNIFSLIKTEIDNNKKKLFFNAGTIAKRDIEVQLYWVPDSLQQLHLAWNVNIDIAGSPDWWNVRIDAKNGSIISKDNWTKYEQSYTGKKEVSINNNNQPEQYLAPPNDVTSASYSVIPFPAENVNVKNFTAVTNPWEMAGTGNNATTYGWHYNGTTTYNISRGNNVYAYDDSAAKNTPGSVATSLTPLPDLSFTFTPDFTQSTSLSVNKSAAITNLFYWNNLMHDVMYQYGFDEAAGNFQASNINRGGIGNDPVLAEAHDGSGLDNSNFSTPDDGSSGRMQMYLWDVAVNPPSFIINTPASIAGSYNSIESGFSTQNKLINVGLVSDTIALYTGDTLACSSVLPSNLKGKIALIYRGTCNFTNKVINAQKAGAVAVVMINTKGSGLIIMSGTNDSITIPAVMISYDDGTTISNSVKAGNTVTATLTGAPLTDGDFDNGVICHEYGHGISHRLTGGNASCLDNNERPDEGWSDYFALMMTQDWANTQLSDSAKSRSIGTYVFGESTDSGGIRTYPYSTNMTVDPHTYADVKSNGEVHYIGEVWCSVLWDMTWDIIKQENSINPNIYDVNGGGNTLALSLVIEGEKLQPCSPGFLDARDAIIAADSILYNGRHKCTIWNAFARRGMGASAVQGSSNNTSDQTTAYDVPVLRLHTDSVPAINDLFTTKLTVNCECQLPQSGYKLIDTIPSGFTLQSSEPQATVQDSLVIWDASNFTSLGQSNVYSITLLPDSTAGCTKDTILYDDRDAHTSGFTSSAARGTTNWTTSTAHSYSPTHSWYAADPDVASDFSLISNSFTPKGFSVFSFHHRFTTEAGYDGGMVDISTNNGSSWTSAAPYFFYNGYNGVIYQYNTSDSSYGTTPMPAFTGALKDSGFIQSFINLSSFAGKPVKVRFRMYTDLGTTYEGWFVDDITLTNGCGGLQSIGLYNNSSKMIGNLRTGTFNIDSNGIVQPAFGDFTAVSVNNLSSLLTWTTISEFSISSFVVERSTDSLFYTTITTPATQGANSSYTFTDNSPVNTADYYRIRMIDANGNTLVTSPVRKVAFTRSSSGITLVPNPSVNGTTRILIDASLNANAIAVFDMAGKRLLAVSLSSGTTSYTLNTSSFSTGIYIVKVISANGDVKNTKLMVSR